MWRLVGDVEIKIATWRKLWFEDDLTLNELDIEEYQKLIKKLEAEQNDNGEIEEYKHYEMVWSWDEIYRNFGLLCIELKHLYVCVTRPK